MAFFYSVCFRPQKKAEIGEEIVYNAQMCLARIHLLVGTSMDSGTNTVDEFVL